MKFGSTTAPANQTFRAWIDYNGDGVFSNQEIVLDQPNTNEASGFVAIPANSATSRALRVRIAAVYFLSAPGGTAFNGCASLTNGQMEDYSIKISANTSAPQADFEAKSFLSCDGKVDFIDRSKNLPATWQWDFGDGSSSSSQNPSHTYASSGSYTVKLTVSNTNGTDSETKTNYIVVDKSKGVTQACIPNSQSHIDDYGIKNVLFNTINNSTGDGRDGYQDYSCTHQSTVTPNTSYNIEVKTGSLNKEDVKVWIDYNNDGTLSTSELVYSSVNDTLHIGSFIIANASVKNTPVRMRVLSDIVGRNLKACDDPSYGQAEDYGIIIKGDTNSPNGPTANFEVDSTQTCLGTVKFSDKSTNNPSSYLWEFGDGTNSTLPSPSHTYATNGKYTVKLTVTNGFGSDSETKADYVEKDGKYCSGTIGIANLSESLDINVFPIPSTGILNLHFPNSAVKKYDLRVYSIDGQVIYLSPMIVEPNAIEQINLSQHPRGVYFLEASTSTERRLFKIVLH
jgi:PKD repeat protein